MKPNKEKYILLLLIIFAAMPMWGQDSKKEEDFDVDKIRYRLIAGKKDEVEVKHKNWADYDLQENLYSGKLVIPATVSYLGKTYRVTAIGRSAFSRSSLTSIHIPNSVIRIGHHAFSYTAIENITLPASLKTIGESMFRGCEKLQSVILPESLQSIESYAFYGCNNLNVVTISKNIKHIGKNIAPYGKISISPGNPYYTLDSGILYNKDKTILYDAYQSKFVGDFSIPQTVNTIADNAFYDCDKLTSVVIPSTVNRIGKSAFYGCSELKSVILPDSITEIASETFYGCKNLANISIPKQVINVGREAFEWTAWLAAQTDTMVYINNILYCYKEKKENKDERRKIEIKEGTTSITLEAFNDRSNISSLSIPSSVRNMGEAILNLSTLTELNVYWNDPALVSLLTWSGELATGDVWINEKCTLIVPKGTKTKYKKNKVWRQFEITEREK